jgi:N-methylhydantoinase A/oxoprolinase/acetone carboxylase beta subunit
MPISLLARDHPQVVHKALDLALATGLPSEDGGRFVVPVWNEMPEGLDAREEAIALRLAGGPLKLGDAVKSRMEGPALSRLVARGQVMMAGITPSDASHVLGRVDAWDAGAAEKALRLFSFRRKGSGDRVAESAEALATKIIDQLTRQTVACLLEAAFAEDNRDWADPAGLAEHPLTLAGLDRHQGVVSMSLNLGVPVIGLGASAPSYYGAVGERLNTRMILPEHAGVANAIGAVVGQVAMRASGTVTSPGPGIFVAHLGAGPQQFGGRDEAIAALTSELQADATARARAAGVEEIRIKAESEVREVEIEGQPMFIEAAVRVTAQGRPRIAQSQ